MTAPAPEALAADLLADDEYRTALLACFPEAPSPPELLRVVGKILARTSEHRRAVIAQGLSLVKEGRALLDAFAATELGPEDIQ